jgi:hypothetical protein
MATQVQTYTVKGGDNLFSIAGNIYGPQNQKMFAEIMRLNGLTSGVIRPGMVLRLPSPKANSQINISHGLMAGINAENEYLQKFGKVPTPEELQKFSSGTSGTSGFNATSLSNVPSSITDREIQMATGTGGLIKNYQPPVTSQVSAEGVSPNLSSIEKAMRGGRSGSAQQQMTNQQRFNQYQYGVSEEQARQNLIKQSPQYETIPGTDKKSSVYQYIPGASGLRAPFSATSGSMAVPLTTVNQTQLREFLASQPASPQMIYNPYTGKMEAMPTGSTQAPAAPATPVKPKAGFGAVTGIPEQVLKPPAPQMFNTSTPNIPKANITEDKLPDPASAQALDPNYLAGIGMTPQQMNYYTATLSKDGLTQSEADQFKYVFNIQPNSQLDQLVNSAIISSAPPPDNSQMVNDIWTSLNEIGYGTMPTEWIVGGGGGGGGGGNAPQYGSGGTWTYR